MKFNIKMNRFGINLWSFPFFQKLIEPTQKHTRKSNTNKNQKYKNLIS